MALGASCLGTGPSQFFQDCPSCQYGATRKKMAEAVVASGACRVQTHCAQGTEAEIEPPAEGPSPGQCAGHTCPSAPPTLLALLSDGESTCLEGLLPCQVEAAEPWVGGERVSGQHAADSALFPRTQSSLPVLGAPMVRPCDLGSESSFRADPHPWGRLSPGHSLSS